MQTSVMRDTSTPFKANKSRNVRPYSSADLRASVETLQTTIAGTFLGAVVAYPLGVLAASTWTPGWVHLPIKGFMAFIRSIPLLLLALLFVSAVGLGPFPGVLAIAVHSIGVLGRFVAEEIESTDPKPLLALQETGASSK